MQDLQSNQKSKVGLYLVIITSALLLLLGLVYYAIIWSESSVMKISNDTYAYSSLQSELDARDLQIKRLEAQAEALKSEQQSVALNLGYIIKPKEELVSECSNLLLGKWEVSQICEQNLRRELRKVLDDKRVVAVEIAGVVDTRPYRGAHAELKQEGLASFRAKEAILLATKIAPNIAVFEGLSQQLPNKRGFLVKAYYVSKE
ncbi:MAG: hypothetical protein MR629_04275 [Helicobacter sp.]|uniref:hypothetical protein n=1 Tax=Helicobacter sp. 10-6591 TaxID=2004998 RepID=UPI000DCB43F4|nr:hypothetical protein [Helicobacter sp. 10-6591]MCI6217744.1 hypothetical protein [Helicobacter sp.]MCI7485687.1 hypothetical protein [Helicobacter sp.]MDD7568138.1 hypothetical protein [Helicobacter sp.]MDY5740969.1 hypothetical protein [Helicobacter sp.]RAX52496.1 hypothetical protein CCY97_07620 [Helicobacter sp. 10-6591]